MAIYVVHNYTRNLKTCVNEGRVSPWVAIYLYAYINTDNFSQWLNTCNAALAAWIIFFCKESRLYLQRPTPQTYTVPFYGPQLCVSPCCPVWIDLLVLVFTWLFAKCITRESHPDPRSEVSYLTTSSNREGKQNRSSPQPRRTTSGFKEKLCFFGVLCFLSVSEW